MTHNTRQHCEYRRTKQVARLAYAYAKTQASEYNALRYAMRCATNEAMSHGLDWYTGQRLAHLAVSAVKR